MEEANGMIGIVLGFVISYTSIIVFTSLKPDSHTDILYPNLWFAFGLTLAGIGLTMMIYSFILITKGRNKRYYY